MACQRRQCSGSAATHAARNVQATAAAGQGVVPAVNRSSDREPPGVGTERNPNYSLSCPLKGHDLLIKVRIGFSPWGPWGMGSGRGWGTHARIIGSVESDEGHFLGAAAHSFLATVGLAAVISKIALPLPEGRSRSLHSKARNGKAFGERELWPAKERLG